jgi:hypothetical protein
LNVAMSGQVPRGGAGSRRAFGWAKGPWSSKLLILALGGCLLGSGCGTAPSKVHMPQWVRAFALQEGLRYGHPYPATAVRWVLVSGRRLHAWEVDSNGIPITTFNSGFDVPTGDFYVIELHGDFRIGTPPGSGARYLGRTWFAIIAPEQPTGFSFTWNPWSSNTPLDLSELGVVKYSAMPALPRVTDTRVPDLVGLQASQAVALLRGSDFRVSVQTVVSSALPPLSVVAERPSPGTSVNGGRIVLLVTTE